MWKSRPLTQFPVEHAQNESYDQNRTWMLLPYINSHDMVPPHCLLAKLLSNFAWSGLKLRWKQRVWNWKWKFITNFAVNTIFIMLNFCCRAWNYKLTWWSYIEKCQTGMISQPCCNIILIQIHCGTANLGNIQRFVNNAANNSRSGKTPWSSLLYAINLCWKTRS